MSTTYRNPSEVRDSLRNDLRKSGVDKGTADRIAEQTVRRVSERVDREIGTGQRKP